MATAAPTTAMETAAPTTAMAIYTPSTEAAPTTAAPTTAAPTTAAPTTVAPKVTYINVQTELGGPCNRTITDANGNNTVYGDMCSAPLVCDVSENNNKCIQLFTNTDIKYKLKENKESYNNYNEKCLIRQ